ncbi:MAG: PqqD family protein [Pyrinomonadaceae bacterium]
MTRVRLGDVPVRGKNVRWKEFGADGILLDVVSGEYAQVDEAGALICRQIDGRKTAGEIIEHVASDFEGEGNTVAEDTLEFMEELLDRGLILVSS